MNEFQYAVEDYIHFIQVERQLSVNTLASYRRDLESYVHFLQEAEGMADFSRVERTTILRHLEQLRAQGKTSRTVARHISSIRSFHQFLLREKRAETDPTVHLEMPTIEQKLPNILSIEEIEALLTAPNRSKPQGIRDLAMLELLYGSGMRISELIALDLADIHLTMGFVRVFGKGGKERIIPLGKSALSAINGYLNGARGQLQESTLKQMRSLLIKEGNV